MSDTVNSYVMSKLGDIRAAFFDCDGTLSVPRYLYKGELCVGMPEEEWVSYNMYNPNAYKYCLKKDSKLLEDALASLCCNKASLYVLTVETTSFAYNHKAKFIEDNFGGYFSKDNVLFCAEKSMKLDIMLDYANIFNLYKHQILFVDDDFSLCLQAQNLGFTVLHSSYF